MQSEKDICPYCFIQATFFLYLQHASLHFSCPPYLYSMCGISGIISSKTSLVNERSLKTMSDTLAHRGPDGEGLWINEGRTAGLSHRRLAIIDLTSDGAQPMHYADRYTIVYNGEIYNYKEIRSDLQKSGYHFKSKSDTEVILAAYDFYGDSCVKYFDGMFAFVIWNEREQKLFCARDTFGEKPFYYFMDNNVFAFASEMKALWAIGVEKRPDEKMMVNYLSLGYVQHASDKSRTFFKDIFALPQAHTGNFILQDKQFVLTRYRDINKEQNQKISGADAVEKLNALLSASVKMRLRSDVEVGSSLSGGTDSSSIAWYVNDLRGNKSTGGFKTFSAVFPGFEKDESRIIDELCARLGLENYTVTPDAAGMIADIEKICRQQEEPFLSSGIYAQYKVYELAAQHGIKVLLDGQGADETLAGYTKYLHWYLQEMTGRHKYSRAKKEKKAFEKNNVQIRWNIKNTVASYLPSHAALALEKREYNKVMSGNLIHPELMHDVKGKEWHGIYKPVVEKLNDILYYSTMENGLEELLRYADRNSMAHGTEVRLPFLNFELVNFIFSLPSSMKINNGLTKYILRMLMSDRLPESIITNPHKIGFEPPQKSWMQDAQVQDLITESKQKLVKEKILKPAVLKNKIVPLHVHDADNIDWRYLNLAQVLG